MFLDDFKSSVHITLKCKRKKDGDLDSGWWGDELLGFELGSKLHFLNRSALTQQSLEETKTYTEEALQPLFKDFKVECELSKVGIRTKITVEGETIYA